MTDPSWKELANVKVAAKPEGLWNMVFPYVCGPRLLRVRAAGKDDKGKDVDTKWKPTANDECGPNGLPKSPKTAATLLVSAAPFGSMVGKIGGSTADLPDTSPGGTYSGRRVFPTGSYAVVTLTSADCGPLFMTINDSPEGFEDHSGELWILIEEAPL